MSMRVKIVAVLVASAAAIFLADVAIERLVVLPKFVALERREAELNLRRVEQAFDRELDQLARTTRNYAEWDDACRFLETRSPEFVKSNLAPETFAMLRLNLIQFYAPDGTLVWGDTRSATDGAPIDIPGLNPADTSPARLLRQSDGKPASLHGMLAVGDGLMMIAANPVLSTQGKGPARGTVVFGRLLSAADEQRLREQTRVSFSLLPADSVAERPGGIPAAIPGGIAFDESRQDILRASQPLNDVYGRPARELQAELPRRITAEGQAALFGENLWMLAAVLVFALVVYWSLGWLVVRPVRRLIRHVQWIRQSGDLSNRIGTQSSDEVGTLAKEFDLLLTQLARSQTARLRSEKQLKAVLQDQPDLIRRFTPEGTTLFVNRAFARYFGVSEERMIGKKEDLPIVDEDRACVEAHWKALTTACPETEVDHRVRLANGDVRWLHWTTRAIFDPDGNVIEMQSVGRDVTRQKQSGSPDATPAASNAAPLVPGYDGTTPHPTAAPSA
jgi:PAS domain S-box-containing protein